MFDARLAGEEGGDDEDTSSDEDEDGSDADASSSSDDDDDDAEEETVPEGTPAILNLRNSAAAKVAKKGKKPGIVVLEDKQSAPSADEMKGVEGAQNKAT